jgi:hypothetical protein
LKRRVFLGVSLTLIAAIVLSAFIIYRMKIKFTVPAINDISSIKMHPAQGALKIDDLFFDLNTKKHRDMVNSILIWLKSGKIMGNAKDEFISDAYSPTSLDIELKDGTSISIISASGSKRYMDGDTLAVDSQDIPGQVTIYISNGHTIREFSPELKSFIDGGWETFFNYTRK